MRLIGLILILLCLTSCSMVSTSFVPVCSPIKAYTKAEQIQAAAELKTCNCPEVKELLKDGYVLRQSNRECDKK